MAVPMRIDNWSNRQLRAQLTAKDEIITSLRAQLTTTNGTITILQEHLKATQKQLQAQQEENNNNLSKRQKCGELQPNPKDETITSLRGQLIAKEGTITLLQEHLKTTREQLQEQRLTIKMKLVELQGEQEELQEDLDYELEKQMEPGRRRIAQRQNWLCAGPQCRDAAENKELGEYEVDHIVPLSLGGTPDNDNLQALCLNCHQKKTDQERLLVAPSVGGEDGQR